MSDDNSTIQFSIDAETLRVVAAIACRIGVMDMKLHTTADGVHLLAMDDSHVFMVACTYPRTWMVGDVELPVAEIWVSATRVNRALAGMEGMCAIHVDNNLVNPKLQIHSSWGSGMHAITRIRCNVVRRGAVMDLVNGLGMMKYPSHVAVPTTTFREMLVMALQADTIANVVITPQQLQMVSEGEAVSVTTSLDIPSEQQGCPGCEEKSTMLDIELLAGAFPPASDCEVVPETQVAINNKYPARFVLSHPGLPRVPISIYQAPRIEYEEAEY